MARLPVRLGGFGFLFMKDTASLADIGALEQAILAFQGERGLDWLTNWEDRNALARTQGDIGGG